MPLYEYYCAECNGIFELLRPVRQSSDPQPCPQCDAESRRLMPTDFNAFVVRDGMPRRIPDDGTYWGLEGRLKNPLTTNDPKPEDIVGFKAKRPDSTLLSEEERVTPKPEIVVRARKKKTARSAAPAADA
ncbi:MAG: zinc ribbon domain-containing protein [Dehalococcoidia bacterium]|nr:zinc ribbon domain-containing protein [Dehalococcoidia bacterium]